MHLITPGECNNLVHWQEDSVIMLSVIMVGPVLVFVAMGVTGTALNTSIAQAILSVEPFGTLLSVATKRLVPYVLDYCRIYIHLFIYA